MGSRPHSAWRRWVQPWGIHGKAMASYTCCIMGFHLCYSQGDLCAKARGPIRAAPKGEPTRAAPKGEPTRAAPRWNYARNGGRGKIFHSMVCGAIQY